MLLLPRMKNNSVLLAATTVAEEYPRNPSLPPYLAPPHALDPQEHELEGEELQP